MIMESILVGLITQEVYGGYIEFPDKKEIRKILVKNGWCKPEKYSRKWIKDKISGAYTLHMAYNLELYPERINAIRPNWPWAHVASEFQYLLPSYKEGQTINIPLDHRCRNEKV